MSTVNFNEDTFESLMKSTEKMAKAMGNLKLTKTLYGAYQDGGDGSLSITIFNSRQEALDYLERTEEQLENGCPYEDGAIIEEEVSFIIDGYDISLEEPLWLYVDC